MASLSEELITLTQAGIRARHPEYSEEAVRLAEIRLRIGDDLYEKAFPNTPKWDS